MAVVSGPLLSFSASGQIAKTMVYSKWKGVPYVRQYLIPANPNTSAQSLTRTTFTFLSDTWKISPADFQAPWIEAVKAVPLTPRNLWFKSNLPTLREQSDLMDILLSPGAKGGLTVTPTLTPGAGTIDVGLVPPDPLPAGWTIVAGVGAAILDQDPTDPTNLQIYVASDTTSPYSVVISGLPPGEYRAAGWFVYQRSESLTDLAYGAGPTTSVAVT